VSLFPDVPGNVNRRQFFYKTDASQLGMRRIRHRKRIYPRWVFYLGWSSAELAATDQQLIENHLTTVRNLPFDWFDWKTRTWPFLRVGVGDGVTLVFDLPGRQTSAQHVFVNGVEQSVSISAGAGANGCDRATLGGAPAVGARISCSFFGNRLARVRTREDPGFEAVADPPGAYQLTTTFYEDKS